MAADDPNTSSAAGANSKCPPKDVNQKKKDGKMDEDLSNEDINEETIFPIFLHFLKGGQFLLPANCSFKVLFANRLHCNFQFRTQHESAKSEEKVKKKKKNRDADTEE